MKDLDKVRAEFGELEAELKDSHSQQMELLSKKNEMQSTVDGLKSQSCRCGKIS